MEPALARGIDPFAYRRTTPMPPDFHAHLRLNRSTHLLGSGARSRFVASVATAVDLQLENNASNVAGAGFQNDAASAGNSPAAPSPAHPNLSKD